MILKNNIFIWRVVSHWQKR